MKALILAAGYATRLYPLTKEYPKPLLKVGNRPIIDYILDKLRGIEGLDEIIVVTNSKFFLKFKAWVSHSKEKKRISLVDDMTRTLSDRRGAIGDMHFVVKKKRLDDDLLVVGGDNIFDGDLKSFIDFARAHCPYSVIGIHDLKDRASASKYGVIKLDRKNMIADFKEKPKKPGSSLVAMCLYYFPKEKLGLLNEYLKSKANKHDATGFYIDWLRKKDPTYGFVFGGRWYDIGDAKFFSQAKVAYSKNRRSFRNA